MKGVNDHFGEIMATVVIIPGSRAFSSPWETLKKSKPGRDLPTLEDKGAQFYPG